MTKKVLVVVDMQNDFIDGVLGTQEAQAIIPKVVEKIRSYEERGDEVLFTMDTHGEDYLKTQEGQKLPIVHCVKGTAGWQLHQAIRPYGRKVFEKTCFGSLGCAEYIAGRGYAEVELIGVCTDICVLTNALLIKTLLPESIVRVDSSCCAGVTPDSHETALAAMRMTQIEIL